MRRQRRGLKGKKERPLGDGGHGTSPLLLPTERKKFFWTLVDQSSWESCLLLFFFLIAVVLLFPSLVLQTVAIGWLGHEDGCGYRRPDRVGNGPLSQSRV